MASSALSNKQIVFTRPGVVEVREEPFPSAPLRSGDIVIETECSIISPGTELACLSGKEAWAPLPFVPGYGSVGRVKEWGSGVEGLAVGQRIFTYGRHARYSLGEAVALPLEEGADPALATFARMGAVAITSLRVADVALGDTVAVFGLGPVGNLAAQLFTLAGCAVVGIDLSARRRELALQCGIAHVLAPGAEALEAVKALTRGRLCRAVVDATGVPAVAGEAITFAGKMGELILLGSPRGQYQTDITPFLNRTHLWDNGCVTVKGAHEWRLPVKEDPSGHGRHSIEGNVRTLLRLIAEGKLRVAPLLTHLAKPEEAQKMYDGLQKEKDAYLGVVFDWRS